MFTAREPQFVTAAYYPVKCGVKGVGQEIINNVVLGGNNKLALITKVKREHWPYLGQYFLQKFWPWIQKYSQQLSTFTAENISLQLKSLLEVGHEASAM